MPPVSADLASETAQAGERATLRGALSVEVMHRMIIVYSSDDGYLASAAFTGKASDRSDYMEQVLKIDFAKKPRWACFYWSYSVDDFVVVASDQEMEQYAHDRLPDRKTARKHASLCR